MGTGAWGLECGDWFVGTEAWGWDCGDGSVGMGACKRENFISSYDSNDFLYWHDSVGVASDYLFRCLFLDNIFWLGTENLFTLYGSYDFFSHWHEALAWQVIICFVVCFWTTYFCWGRSLGTGVLGWENGAESNIFLRIYFKKHFFIV